ncbi:MAG: 3-oxoacyl-[acyl-carrier-protein] synthase 3 [Oligoflexia bacterium]|nr:MAG: 3-oxoacyl-[acyl-carrier-protein] synthase 3 [Oligoflexia bacterium]
MLASRIAGIGGYVPPRCVTNKELEQVLDTTDEWIQQRTGIQTRHWVAPEVATSDLALEAAKLAINDAKIKVTDIDMIIMATSTPDHDVPGAGCFLQAKLGLPGVPYFEVKQACSGFVYGLSLADQFIKTGHKKCILLIGVELQSKLLDMTPRGRGVSVIFADGAGAAVITPTDVQNPEKDSYVMSTTLHADGAFAKELWIPAPGTAIGPQKCMPGMIESGDVYLQMNARYVFSHAVTKMPAVMLESLEQAKKKMEDVDLFFFHQANMRINEKVAEDLKIPREKIHNTIHKFGNTTAATIPLGMWDALQEGKLKRGQLIGVAAFGAGFTWAGAVFRY